MATQIITFQPTGLTLYAVVFDPTSQAWNTSNSAFEPRQAAHWTNYAIALSDSSPGTGVYAAPFPAAVVGIYSIAVFKQLGGSPAVGDSFVGPGAMDWSGTAEVSISDWANLVSKGTVTAVSSSSSFTISLGGAVLDAAIPPSGAPFLCFTSGVNAVPIAEKLPIITYARQAGNTTAIVTFNGGFSAAPTIGDTFVLI